MYIHVRMSDNSLALLSATFRCNNGYALTGPSSVLCTSDPSEEEGFYDTPSNWPPVCVQILCTAPPVVENGVWGSTQNPPGGGCAVMGSNLVGNR